MSEHGIKAKALFKNGYNCTQSVVGAYAEELGLDMELAMRLSSGFGGGMGRMREVCGAVSGMTFVISMLDGYSGVDDTAQKKALYEQIQTLANEFRRENGSIVCRELLAGMGKDVAPTPSARTEVYYRKRPCAELVEQAADILEPYVLGKLSK